MKLKTWFSVIAVALTVFVVQAQDMKEEDIIERIKPLGSVHVAGAQSAAASGGNAGGARSGEAVYSASCVACHGSGVLGAPKLQVAGDWQPRLDARGYDVLIEHAIEGFNAMPPMGTCGNCSNDEIQAAVDYMLEGI